MGGFEFDDGPGGGDVVVRLSSHVFICPRREEKMGLKD